MQKLRIFILINPIYLKIKLLTKKYCKKMLLATLYHMKKYITFITLFCSAILYAQTFVQGKITIDENGHETPAIGVEVYWQGTAIGTTTAENGRFMIPYKPEQKKLIISYLGFKTETIIINDPMKYITITLVEDANQLDGVEVVQKRKSTEKLYHKTANVININSSELLKAACCNLSDSFETNTSVDVSVSDALTGTKQIKMLGLSSPYLLMTQENIPSIRGASQVYGMTFVPGTWVEGIQIIKGAGSVINGYESIAGQINTELVKPPTDKPFFLNLYGSNEGRLELNTHLNGQVAEHWHSGFYLHGNHQNMRSDMNYDGFLDMPLGHQFNVMNRWQYTNSETGWESKLLFHFFTDERTTGEKNFRTELYSPTYNIWGSNIKTNQFNVATKVGYVWKDLGFQSIGFQGAYKYYDQVSYFGRSQYDIRQHSGYFNAIFSSIISNTFNKFSTGITTTFDGYDEFVNVNATPTNYDRNDYGVGAFFEYAYDNTTNFSFTAGLRADYHNRLGFFVTPRLHMRYMPWNKGVLRFSVGQGRRVANIFAENQKFFSSARKINLMNQSGKIYGLNPEKAWNYGVSFLQGFKLAEREGDISVDFYRTDFQNQVVVDWENPRLVSFYNLEGKSYANSLQAEINYQILKGLNLKVAYKYYDVQTDYTSGKKAQPLQAKHRFFANLAYDTPIKQGRQWRFDYTFNRVGEQRLPSTATNPQAYRLSDYTKPYNVMNAQITRAFSDNFEIYLGGENLTNYKQKNAILASDDPFGAYFDTSMVYAPVFGRMIYAGLRFHLAFNKK